MRRAWLAALLLLLAAAGCGDGVRRYPAQGVVRDVQAENGQVLIEHGDIRGLMPAMTMNFDIDPALARTLSRGERVDFVVAFDGHSYRVVEATGRGQEAGAAAGPGLSDVAQPRDPAPDFELVDQAGRPVSLDSLRGRTLLVDFVYTNCPGPCPIQTGLKVELEKSLSPELRERTHFVSISLDPQRDTPEALRAYAEKRGADLSHWSFLTGPPGKVAAVLRGFGVGTAPGPDGTIDHVIASFLVDGQGRIAERYMGLDLDLDAVRRDLARVSSSG